jgi:hypothetical protein
VPVDSRLPGGGGNQLCGFYNISPAKFGQAQNLITTESHFGKETRVFNGVDVSVNYRTPNGASIGGGTSTGRSETNTCFTVNSPGTPVPQTVDSPIADSSSAYSSWSSAFCDQKPPFQTQVKALGTYPLPWWGLQASATLASLPGPEISATTYVATNAQIKPTLGRDLASGPNGTVKLPMMAPGSVYGDRVNKLDARFSKTVKINNLRLLGSLDIFNVFNSSDTLTFNTRYGPRWLYPTSILGPRLFRVSAQFNF